jgi:hypothetical protein
MLSDDHGAHKSHARKPSAILEEIESMFGSPDMDSLSEFLLDDSMAALSSFGTQFLDTDAAQGGDDLGDGSLLDDADLIG